MTRRDAVCRSPAFANSKLDCCSKLTANGLFSGEKIGLKKVNFEAKNPKIAKAFSDSYRFS